MRSAPKPVVLLILDGFGISREARGNAILAATKPNFEAIERRFPFTSLQASGIAVGLPWEEPGNSEVGHLTMGAGRVIYHHLPRIINAIRDGSFFENPAFRNVIAHVRERNSSLHLLGLVSSGSVHSYAEHLDALLALAKREGVARVFLHAITDGKDAPPEEGVRFIGTLEERMAAQYPNATLASLVGRFYAMDRDANWDRIRTAYELIARGTGAEFQDPAGYLAASYGRGMDDERIAPAARTRDGAAIGRIRQGDGLILFNFREDSMRELIAAFAQEPLAGFPREKLPDLAIATMTDYGVALEGVAAAFGQIAVERPLGRALAEAGMRQLRIAETEKYAHVTYFFNAGIESPFPEETRIMVQSLPVTRFDEEPEMKAPEITARILEHLDEYDFILANLANADLVGHSGNFQAVVRAVEAIDAAVGRIRDAVLEKGGCLLITADHGNAEAKLHPISGETVTEHTANPVPFYLIGKEYKRPEDRTPQEIALRRYATEGILTDVAPTVLDLMGIPKPAEMTGKSLLPVLLKERS